MKEVISTERIPIKLWLNDIEEGALKQAKNLANLPFAFKHIAIMPDCHQGYGMPIGGVLATENVIIPNAVGVDIGCGIIVKKTGLTEISKDDLKSIMGKIREKIPVGFNHHDKPQSEEHMPEISMGYAIGGLPYIINREYESAKRQVGTLGGGNHFIEIQKNNEGHIYIMIHSGSRNLGKKVADHYNKLAKELNKKWYSFVPKEHDLAFLPINTKEASDYILEMNYCVNFALSNRKLIMKRVIDSFEEVIGIPINYLPINIAHNYAKLENHFGKNVWIHRKGATKAYKDDIGIIPGSQGTSSYIVKGKGNLESFMSCSHGAGRKIGRKQAIKELNLNEEIKKMNEQGIIHRLRHQKDLDEASGAYKDIDIVMENQKDLVEIVTELKPLAVIKG